MTLCDLGFHRWSDPAYVAGRTLGFIRRTCRRCELVELYDFSDGNKYYYPR